MWEKLVSICEEYVEKEINPNDLQSFNGMKMAFAAELQKIYFDKNNIPFGRYLLANNIKFNIQMDVFSNNYKGSIHSHGTWGMFGMISGALMVDDWVKNNNDFSYLRSSLLLSGCINTFIKKNDWHGVSTTDFKDQTVSIHIYGAGYNLDKGFKLNEGFRIIDYTRSKFLDFEDIKSHFIYNS